MLSSLKESDAVLLFYAAVLPTIACAIVVIHVYSRLIKLQYKVTRGAARAKETWGNSLEGFYHDGMNRHR
jgi:hypothetical protein